MKYSALKFLLLFLAFLPSLSVQADTPDRPLLVIVSDRSADSLVSSAHRFLSEVPEQSVSVRTVSQINLMSDEELQTLISQSGAVLMAAVFGEPVERLLNLKWPDQQLRLAVNGDRRLLSLHSDPASQYRSGLFEALSDDQKSRLFRRLTDTEQGSYLKQLSDQKKQWPQFRRWLQARGYWQNRNDDNRVSLLKLMSDASAEWNAIQETRALRLYLNAGEELPVGELKQKLSEKAEGIVFVLDHDTGDRPGDWQLHEAICASLQNIHCVSVLSAWGEPSAEAVRQVQQLASSAGVPYSIVSLQDFVVGGGDGREAVTELFSELNTPVFKGIRVTGKDDALYELSSKGLPDDSIHYRVAMPELQGVGQAHVLALSAPQKTDERTGARVSATQPVSDEVQRLVKRISAWHELKTRDNADKHVAIVFYNHPPGRHNIGADNLNVPESLWEMLQALKKDGYDLGPEDELPQSAEALLDILQQKAVNLPEDAQALEAMSGKIHNMPPEQYREWFAGLPETVQKEMVDGPLGYMHQMVVSYLKGERQEYIRSLDSPQRQIVLDELTERMDSTMHDLHHALDGVRHEGRERALKLLDQLEEVYLELIASAKLENTAPDAKLLKQADSLQNALLAMKIEGIRGWGEAPGKTMVWKDRILIPGVRFGNVFLGPQPPRGWELNEELLHANLSFPPPHQYLAFYHYLADDFKADAIIHVGRHSTYEFLPKRGAGLSASDYPSIAIQHIPSIYPYIVDGVGEGIQAKRRGMAVMVDHLTPPLAITELYDGLLELRQLIESAEAATDETTQQKAIRAMRHKIDVLNLRDELIASMDEELQVRGVGFSDVDDDFLLHEVGHYLTHLQEEFMPLGLHVFGRQWDTQSVDVMVKSMSDGDNLADHDVTAVRTSLEASPAAEMDALLNALKGGFVAPGKGNDPIRTPDALPTGRNFYALDGSLLPTELGVEIGRQLAEKARTENLITPVKNQSVEKDAVILWASDAVRDEGAMIAFGLDMLGVEPVWNSRGILKSLRLLPLDKKRIMRRDVLFTSSGLFRDLYGAQLELLDKAVLLALSASRKTIYKDYPALTRMLNETLSPVTPMLEKASDEGHYPDNESLDQNMVARNWVYEASALLRQNPDATAEQQNVLARQASLRVFGTAPGAYGAGINRLAERSGAWEDRSELGKVFINRMGHVYGTESEGLTPGTGAQDLFRTQLSQVGNTYLGRASNLYGLIDNNDAFDYLGGLNLAVETVTGEAPDSFVISHADNSDLKMDPLQIALLTELRGRFLNRQWIEPLMDEGYAGARTMGNEFVEYLWGWQVTSPQIIKSWVWDEVKAVYLDDSLDTGLDEFLKDNHNVHVQTNIMAIMLVAADKGFWQADEETLKELAEEFADNITQHGIPGSGHTHANHPVYDFVKPLLSEEKSAELDKVLDASRITYENEADSAPVRIQEIDITDIAESAENAEATDSSEQNAVQAVAQTEIILVIAVVLLLMVIGFVRSRRLK